MNVNDLHIRELLSFDQDGGIVQFAGQRAVIVNATALGSLRKDLIDYFGSTAARGLLTRFGYVHGWNIGRAIKDHFSWENDVERHGAGSYMPVFQGMYCLEEGQSGPLSTVGITLTGSFEAEQHIAHLGRSDLPTCWVVSGLLSGYLSYATDEEIYVLEETCIGRGDAACHLLGRTSEEWGDERAEELAFFHIDDRDKWLDESLHRVTTSLKEVEQKLHERMRLLSRFDTDPQEPEGLIARSPQMERLLDLARRVAAVDSTVLITGESGSGKELIARFVHDHSLRARSPFITLNCGAINDALLDSELFGHARGAFTGASQARAGLFEAAHGGTLLLDEIGEVSPAMQVKLLRVLEEREVRRVGENQSRPVDVRVIGATNTELTAAIAEGKFRRDLYYRLNVVELHVPPLRERRDDILPLARMLLADAAVRLKRPMNGLSPRAADQLLRYEWPGNVRELANAMERAVAIARVQRLEYDDLPEEVRHAVAHPAASGRVRELADVEKDYILSVLDRNDGNQSQTAKQLGIGTATLYRKLKKYQEEHAEETEPPPDPEA